jgi:hypothetical protein
MAKFRKAQLHCGGTDFWGYIGRDPEQPRTRSNTWNGWECPVMTREQVKDFIELQDWRLFEGENVDKWEMEKEGVRIWNSEDDECEGDLYQFREVETIDGETIEVVGTPCYTFELGWGHPNETYNMDSLKASPYWIEKMRHG